MLENTGFTLALGALCLVLFIGLGIPLAIYFARRRGRGSDEFSMYSRMASRMRNPWQDEDRDLEELSRRVRELDEE